VVVVVSNAYHRQEKVRALRRPGTPEATNVLLKKAAPISRFIGNDGSVYGVTVHASKDARARMNRLPELAAMTKCSRLILVNQGYTIEDLKRRRISLPDECGCFFATESEFMGDVLEAGPEIRRTLRHIFGEPEPRPPSPPIIVIDDDDDEGDDLAEEDEFVAQAERQFAELEAREQVQKKTLKEFSS
jgi:hypothetical protein